MKLSTLYGKSIYTDKNLQGVCRGVAISLKSYAVRYLLCASTPTQCNADFSIGIGAVAEVGEIIRLSHVRTANPRGYAKITVGLPIYAFDGCFLGTVADLDISGFTATTLYTSRGERFPITSIAACSDAVILRKEQPYPIGQPIPTPSIFDITNKNSGVVTKQILRTAIEKKSLIALTLSLPPFQVESKNPPSNSIFCG